MNLGMFFVRGIDNRMAADFSNFSTMAIKRPATYFTGTDDIFDEQDATAESQGQFVKKFDVL